MRGNTKKYLILTVNVNVRMQVENSFSKRKDCEK